MKNNAGMTFLEVLIALFLFTMMVSAVFPVFLTTRKMDLTTKAFTEGRQLAQTHLEWVYTYFQILDCGEAIHFPLPMVHSTLNTRFPKMIACFVQDPLDSTIDPFKRVNHEIL